MTNLRTRLPTRRLDLVSWRAGENGPYLIRNRASGETFQFGDEEHFLLERLDGRQTSGDICRAFSHRFARSLSPEDLEDFVRLAEARGLLSSNGEADAALSPVLCTESSGSATPKLFWKRAASLVLKGASKVLGWPARRLNGAAGRLDRLRLRRLDFVPRPDDVFIVTYPRSGTTWMQMILYQLTTDGRMDFPHIAEYCPWFDRSSRSARAFETRPSPRLFKSHLSYRKIPKGPSILVPKRRLGTLLREALLRWSGSRASRTGVPKQSLGTSANDVPRQSLGTRPKYIYVARNGNDVAVSYYHLYRTYNGYEGTFEDFFERFLKGKTSFGCWFKHVKGWWEHRDDPNVLFLTYEELQRDLEGCIRRIAGFIGREVPPERMPGIVDRCSFAFMKRHEHKFDPVMESLWEQGVQLKSFLRHGRAGDGSLQLNAEQQARFFETFDKRLRAPGLALS